MAGEVSAHNLKHLNPSLSIIKTRLLISTYIHANKLKHAEELISLYRPFVVGLSDKARGRALGVANHDSYHSLEAMNKAVMFHKLEKLISECWSTTLNITERALLHEAYELEHPVKRLDFGITGSRAVSST